MEEDEDEEEEEEEENEDGEENENEDGDFTSIKDMIAQKKKEEQAALEADDPSLKADDELDSLDLAHQDWDLKFNVTHYAIFFGHANILQLLLDAGGKNFCRLIYGFNYLFSYSNYP